MIDQQHSAGLACGLGGNQPSRVWISIIAALGGVAGESVWPFSKGNLARLESAAGCLLR